MGQKDPPYPYSVLEELERGPFLITCQEVVVSIGTFDVHIFSLSLDDRTRMSLETPDPFSDSMISAKLM